MNHFRLIKTGFSLGLISLVLQHSVVAEVADKYSEVEFNLSNVSLITLVELGLPMEHHGADEKNLIRMPISQYDMALLKSKGIPFRFLLDDLARYTEKRNIQLANDFSNQNSAKSTEQSRLLNFKLGTMGGYLNYAEIVRELDEMRTKFPGLISVKMDLGKSHENRTLWAVRVSNKPDVEQARPRVMYDALAHAREPMSMMNVIYFLWHVLENYNTDPNVKKLLDNLEIYAVPCMNPDGYEFNRSTNPGGGGLWRKNRFTNADGSRGVDLNRNFSTFWGDNSGSSGVGSTDTYRGTAAFSEPETRAIRDIRLAKKFALSFNHHSYANRVLTPYGIGGWPANKAEYERIAKELTRVNGWQFGPTPVMLGYSVSGAIKDWGHEVANEYAFGSELGSSSEGFWPPQNRIEPLAASALDMNLALARNALPAVVRLSMASNKIASHFYAEVSNSKEGFVFKYQLTDAKQSWYLSIHDMQGRKQKIYSLSKLENSIVLPHSGFIKSLYFLEVKSCSGAQCKSVYLQKLLLGSK